MESIKPFPKEEGLDHSLSLLREGYLFVTSRADAFQSDLFETRLLGERAVCMRGEEAAELFYDNSKFKRHGAAPKRVLKTLLGETGVQTLDGEEHRHRKAMFMSLMNRGALVRMRAIVGKQWMLAAGRWEAEQEINLYEEAQLLLCRAACEWAGVPLDAGEAGQKAEWLAAMYESPASLGMTYIKGRRSRRKAEKWIGELVDSVRAGTLHPPEGAALHTIALHRDLKGELLETKTASVEVLNILRPIVAVAVYIAFAALAVIQQPQEKARLASSDEDALKNFVQEVRRFYPFFPFSPARAVKDFEWGGYKFHEGMLVLLDLYGTNHHPRLWSSPALFQPDRFREWSGSPFRFVPQGGGDHDAGHRCAGEWITLEIMKESLDFLANKLRFEVPEQDVSFSFGEMPSLPHSRIRLQKVRAL
ncbi:MULTISPECIES: cytochrome P450 [unclassified Paenibacillus]|uniref:cytochrome P450 n=1 Tax=unclassified Paenibacillus TaxID=185978 RepID=UPI0009561CB9|nr:MULTISPECIES: cytochrome P450 [unclassified Paenibacillus]ASS68612.1 cytochrome P450 [Paenibacillus sp. RUD330]SIR64638.1 fatty-acid peroxygenase [Paenibacillus sp. RU4X]SIR72584.1 fatty-acid peroxygenase [Paenibacillus sp. RU4T]